MCATVLAHAKRVLTENKEYKKAPDILVYLKARNNVYNITDLENVMMGMDYCRTDFTEDILLLNAYCLIALLDNDDVILTEWGKEILRRLPFT